MSAPRLRILLDAHVWIDFFVPGRSGSATAIRLVRDAIEANAELFYSSRVLADLFYEIRRDAAEWVRASSGDMPKQAARLCHDYAWGCIGMSWQAPSAPMMPTCRRRSSIGR